MLIFARETVLALWLVVLHAEFDPASSDCIFEGGRLGLGVGVGEDGSENQGDTDPLPLPYTHIHILTHPPQKYNHSTQDQILRAAQPTRELAQFHELISARISAKSF